MTPPHQPATVRGIGGFSLLEVLVASVITLVVVVGTAAAFVTAARMTRAQSNTGNIEAAGYARETVERFRNMIACDSPWFDPATCAPTSIPAGWQPDPLPGAAGSESILATGMLRCYRVTQQDCDGVGGVGDCLAVEARVCWNNDLANCPC